MSTNDGTLTVDQGVVDINSTGQVSFATTTLTTGGTLLLDNSSAVLNNRLGGATEVTTQTVVSGTARTLNFAGGELAIDGGASAAVAESLGTVSISGGGLLVLSACQYQKGVNLTLTSLNNQGQNTSWLIMGDGLGTAAGANVATLSATGITWRGSGTTAGTTTLRVREDIVVDTSSTDTTFTGSGVGFATADASGLVRPLNQTTELFGSLTGVAGNTTNVGLSSLAAGTISASVNPGTLTLESAGGGVQSGALWPAILGVPMVASWESRLRGKAVFSPRAGNTGISLGELTNFDTMDIHVLGAGVLNLNGALVSSNGVTKADGGTLVLGQAFVNNSGTIATFAINGGTVRLAAWK